MNDKLRTLKAWCSGVSYQIPNRTILNCSEKSIELFIGTIPLAKFYLRTTKDLSKGMNITTHAIMKG